MIYACFAQVYLYYSGDFFIVRGNVGLTYG